MLKKKQQLNDLKFYQDLFESNDNKELKFLYKYVSNIIVKDIHILEDQDFQNEIIKFKRLKEIIIEKINAETFEQLMMKNLPKLLNKNIKIE